MGTLMYSTIVTSALLFFGIGLKIAKKEKELARSPSKAPVFNMVAKNLAVESDLKTQLLDRDSTPSRTTAQASAKDDLMINKSPRFTEEARAGSQGSIDPYKL